MKKLHKQAISDGSGLARCTILQTLDLTELARGSRHGVCWLRDAKACIQVYKYTRSLLPTKTHTHTHTCHVINVSTYINIAISCIQYTQSYACCVWRAFFASMLDNYMCAEFLCVAVCCTMLHSRMCHSMCPRIPPILRKLWRRLPCDRVMQSLWR